MSFLDDALGQFNGGFDLNAVAARVGLPEGQIDSILHALTGAQNEPGDTAEGAAARTGLPVDTVRAVLAHIGGEDGLSKVGDLLGSAGGLGDIARGFGAKPGG